MSDGGFFCLTVAVPAAEQGEGGTGANFSPPAIEKGIAQNLASDGKIRLETV